ncbi:MAG: glycosyl transferase family 1 [Candidatus Altarchaeum sp. CG12_big_fil_rev_8_21_14_0_65_33_22]|nr:MAG: glycosyl transferase family 1 [Candidatus Altarchaeum sp. CG12_big_fil_rev_8_21_14_0_65_33_22]PIV27019.1 MAG: glycosyl transferase family 1 [Candidatus Altarchaeum sp. CG03_land_8_20_14_0_80_32_618]
MANITVCLYTPMKDLMAGNGISSAITQQISMLKTSKINVTSDTADFDILHINTPDPFSLYAIYEAKLRKKPVVIHTHISAEDFRNSFIFSNSLSPVVKDYLKYFYGLADTLVCPSEYTKKLLVEQYNITKPIKVISNGIKIERFKDKILRAKRDIYRKKFNLNGKVVFCCAGVFERKGLSAFINVAKTLKNKNKVSFVWFGKILPLLTPATTLKTYINQKNVIFTDYVEDIQAAYASGDIFLFPTREENQGIALLEAIASKKPVIVRNIEVFDWLVDGVDCLKAKNDKEFIAKTKILLNNHRLGEKLAENAYKKLISEGHDLKNIEKKYREMYTNLLKNRSDLCV